MLQVLDAGNNLNGELLKRMLDQAVCTLTGRQDISAAWSARSSVLTTWLVSKTNIWSRLARRRN